MTQYEAIIEALKNAGGVATLGQLYSDVLKIPGCKWKSKTPFASIRCTLQRKPAFYKIRPGLYGLVDMRKSIDSRGIMVETPKNKNSSDISIFNHSYFQGLLLLIGNMKNMKTFVPNQDKNRKFYDGRKLGELATLHEQPNYSYDSFVKRSSTIDTIWFGEREMPHSFFEIEHSTDIQNSLLKFNDLQDFYVRMVIVADSNRKEEFKAKMNYSSFDELRKNNRVNFLSYSTLTKQYEQELEKQKYELVL